MTALVPAYRETSLIAMKVADLRSNGYPGELDVLVVADDEETAAAARDTGARVVSEGARGGKARAINLGFHSCNNPIVVLSDANTSLDPGSLARLARWFSDPSVGAVAGEKRLRGGEGAYWRFEGWLKRRESARGTTIGLVGELAAVRRSCFIPLPTDLAVDDLWLALDVIEQGKRIVYEPGALAQEDPSGSLAADWERRTRVVSGGLDVIWRRRKLLVPGSGGVADQLWGHRLIRLSAGPLAHLLLLVWALKGARTGIARVFLAPHALAALALARQAAGDAPGPLGRVAAQVVFLQAVAIGGLARYLRRDRPALWPKQDR